ncbi:RING finger protein 11 [Planococcus citri]|uniref:RING finger protein 11 n=1 Tax=Planococcus citri TaxID=170843 RepID=UPI0031F8E4AD
MGNCLKGTSNEDISLLRGNEGLQENTNEAVQPIPYRDRVPVYYPAPNDRRPANQLSEEEQVRIARRIGLMEHLPILAYDDSINKNKECVICMIEFKIGEEVRYLPCMHVYHVLCIDDWLMRSFTCPSCMEPVDAALLTSYDTN